MNQRRNQKENVLKYLEKNNNGHTTHQDQWDSTKVVLRGKFIVISA